MDKKRFSKPRMLGGPKEDYISGPHSYWPHFICGFIFGAFVGVAPAGWIFDGTGVLLIAGVAGGISVGLFAGKWGERAWKPISEWFSVWWRGL